MTNLPILQSEVKTMSSREMAQLCQKRHDNVLQLIRNLIDGGILKSTTPHNYTHPQNGQTYIEFLSDKRDSLVIVARLSPEFTAAVIDRWQELESQQPQISLPNFTDPAEAAIAWANEYKAKQALAIELKAAEPKINFYDKVGDSNNLLIASKIGQSFKTNPMSAVTLNKHLEKFDVYNMAIKSGRVFKQWFVDKGLGRMVQNDNGYPQAKFTTDGQQWITEMFTNEGII